MRIKGKSNKKGVVNIIELNSREYGYTDICTELGWRIQSGNNSTKKKQIACIESSYEFFHPINPKTKKEKKTYVFTKKIKEPVLDDNRKNNGGFRENAGRKKLLSDEDFEVIWKSFCYNSYRLNFYGERDYYNKICFTNSELFKFFGFDFYEIIDNIEYDDEDDKVKLIFEDIIYSALKSNTISKLSKRYDCPKNSLPKTILRSQSKENQKRKVEDSTLLKKYNKFESEALESVKCKSFAEAVRKGKKEEVVKYIEKKFDELKKYNVKRINAIMVNDIDFSLYQTCANISIAIKPEFENEYTRTIIKAEKAKLHFNNIIIDSVEKSCLNRVVDDTKYKHKLNLEQKKLLINYLSQLTKKEYKNVIKENTHIIYAHNFFDCCNSYDEEEIWEGDWLDLII